MNIANGETEPMHRHVLSSSRERRTRFSELGYTPVSELSPTIQAIAGRFTKRRDLPGTPRQIHPEPPSIPIEDLKKLPSYYGLLTIQDFADADRAIKKNGEPTPFTFGTQRNSQKGQIQIGKFDSEGGLTVFNEGVINYQDSKAPFVNQKNPEAWAPTPVENDDRVELFISMAVLGELQVRADGSQRRPSKRGMGIVVATAKDFDKPFQIQKERPLARGRDFRIIDQHFYAGRVLNDHRDLKGNKVPLSRPDTPRLLYGSMPGGDIFASTLHPSHERFEHPVPVSVLSPDKRVPQSSLIEAPIIISACGEEFLFVSGCGCFGEHADDRNDEYLVMQTKFDSVTGKFVYRSLWDGQEDQNSAVLASNQWFFNPGHPSIYRLPEDAEDQLTMDFAAIPWYRDANEQAKNVHEQPLSELRTDDNRVRYLFRCKLKLRNGWWEIDRTAKFK